METWGTLKPWMKHSNSVFFILRTHQQAMEGKLATRSRFRGFLVKGYRKYICTRNPRYVRILNIFKTLNSGEDV